MPMSNAAIGHLRPMADADLAMVLEWRNQPDVRKNMYTQHVISMEEHTGWWARIRQSAEDSYMIFEAEGAAFGVVGFNRLNKAGQRADWAFYAAPAARKGMGSRMEFLALDHAFGPLQLKTLCCEVLDFNVGVLKLHQKFGFHPVTGQRQQRQIGGKMVEVHRLAIDKSDWADRRLSLQKRLLERL